jgi:peptide/nickel transport system substrate-binding protein
MVAIVAVLAVVAAACGGDDDGGGTTGPTATGGETGTTGTTGSDLAGGTLRMAQLSDVTAAFDPQKEYYSVTWEYYRCCLLRTLMSYKGVPTDQGGTEVFPDLAASDPTQSDDGLTWTFTLKTGINYGDPFTDTPITAGDFVRAIERTANPKANVGGYSFYYSVIEGFDDFAAGEADSISGMVALDDQTVAITTTSPTGDIPYRFAMPTTAPIPPNGEARLGAAEGHDKDYGRYLVASGPYQFQGAAEMDFSVPAKDQEPAAGYVPGRQIVLERNPGYDPATDDLRPAYPDAIEVSIGGNNDDLYNQIAAGALDNVVDGVPPAEKIREYQSSPDLQPLLTAYPSDGVRYISMNLAVPPFDDIHVRKALNWVVDKDGMRQLRGGPTTGSIAGHIIVDSLENNLLLDYDPYATPDSKGDLTMAQEEMAQSKYDSDGDGVCDDPVCDGVLAMTDREDPYPKQAALLGPLFEQIGITMDVKELERSTMYNKCMDANSATAICLAPSWGKDYADAITFGEPLFTSAGLWESCCNYSLLGATADQLRGWGYGNSTILSVDEDVSACSATPPGDARFQCWADLDKKLMEEVVPWVPYLFDTELTIVSANVVNFSFDQFAGLPAFDHMAVAS